jgi:hypothetical protein
MGFLSAFILMNQDAVDTLTGINVPKRNLEKIVKDPKLHSAIRKMKVPQRMPSSEEIVAEVESPAMEEQVEIDNIEKPSDPETELTNFEESLSSMPPEEIVQLKRSLEIQIQEKNDFILSAELDNEDELIRREEINMIEEKLRLMEAMNVKE